MAPPTKEQIAARADYLFGVHSDQMLAARARYTDGRSDAQWRTLIAEQLTMLIFEHGMLLNTSTIELVLDPDHPDRGIMRIGGDAPGLPWAGGDINGKA